MTFFGGFILPYTKYYSLQYESGFQSQCLIEYNLETSDENILASNVVIAFYSGNNVYYITQESEDFSRKMYIYSDNESSIMFEELPVYSDISSAYFDEKNKILYYADYSRIYVCDTNKLNNLTEDQHFENAEVFSVAQSYVNILPCPVSLLVLEIGHNMVSLYEIGG